MAPTLPATQDHAAADMEQLVRAILHRLRIIEVTLLSILAIAVMILGFMGLLSVG